MTQQRNAVSVHLTDSLEQIAFKLNHWHRSAGSLADESLEFVRKAGEALCEIKARIGHGSWLTWLNDNCPKISERFAQRAMQIARSWPAIQAAAATRDEPLTVSSAIESIATPRPKPTTLSDLNSDNGTGPTTSPPQPDQPDPQESPASQISNPTTLSDLNAPKPAAVDVQPLPEVERTDPARNESMPPLSPAVVEPVIRSRPSRRDGNEARSDALPQTQEGTYAEFKRLGEKIGEAATLLSRTLVLGRSLDKRVGDGATFVQAVDAAHRDIERWGKLLKEWSDTVRVTVKDALRDVPFDAEGGGE